MDSNTGGQSSDRRQRETAAAIARKKVLEAYANNGAGATNNTSDDARLKDKAVQQKVNNETWRRYHTAWQKYYQNYYSEYYSKAAQTYIAKEKLKREREEAAEEEALASITRSSSRLGKKKDGMALKSGVTIEKSASEIADDRDIIKARLKRKIRKQATENAKKAHRYRRLIPIFVGGFVALFILFMQYNRLIFAPIMAYVSPGDAPASEIEAIDPTISQEVSADPRLIIPKLNVDVPIRFDLQLTDVMAAMNNGVAHYRINGASAYPGEIGNTVITGHSAGDVYSSNPYKYIFSGLERLEDGDLIYINYNSTRYTYKVVKKEVVEPSNVASLIVQTNKPLLTLVTCTPLGTSRYRLLVTAEQISPSYEGAETSASDSDTSTVDENTEALPSNEPTFFEGIWNWLTGN